MHICIFILGPCTTDRGLSDRKVTNMQWYGSRWVWPIILSFVPNDEIGRIGLFSESSGEVIKPISSALLSYQFFHGDVIKWKHFPFVRHWSPAVSPHKGQQRGALMFFVIYAWTNDWANSRNAGYLRPHPAHYDTSPSKWLAWWTWCLCLTDVTAAVYFILSWNVSYVSCWFIQMY